MDVRFYGAKGQVESGRYLLVRTAFDVPQENTGAILGAKAGDRPLDGAAKLPRLELLEGGLLLCGHFDRRRLDLGLGGGVRRSVQTDGVDLTPPQVIDRNVIGDLEQPAGELEFGPISVEVIEDLDEAVLGEIFGRFPVPHHSEDERKHRALVSAHEFAKCRLPPVLGEGDEIGVG